MGVIDLVANSATYIGDVSPYLPRGGVAGIAQSGSVTDAFVHSGNRIGFSRIISCGSEVVLDVCDYLAYCLDDPETSSVILFVEGFKRPERFLALADRALELGKPIMAVKVGRSDQAQAAAIAHSGSLAGETRVTDAALDAAGVIRCRDLDELLETAELVEGIRRTGPPGRSRPDRGRDGLDRRGVAHRRPRAARPGSTCRRSRRPPGPAILEALPTMGYIGNPLDPWGAADPATAYGAAFEAMAASGAYDVLVLVHDFPYRSLPSEVATANEVTRALLAATARPSRDPAGLRVADLGRAAARDEGAARRRRAAARRSCAARVAGVPGDRRGRPLGGAPRARGSTAVRGGPAGRPSPRTGPRSGPTRHRPCRRGPTAGRAVRAREPGLRRRGRDRRSTEVVGRDRRAPPPSPAARTIGRPVALKLDAVGLAHKSEVGGVALGLRGDDAVYGAALTLLEIGRRRGLAVRGPAGRADGRARRRADPRPAARPAVRPGRPGRAGRGPDRGPRRRRDPARADRRRGGGGDARRPARGAHPARRSAAGPPSIGRRSSRCSSRSAGSASIARTSSRSTSTRSSRRPAGAVAVDALVVLEEPPDAELTRRRAEPPSRSSSGARRRGASG